MRILAAVLALCVFAPVASAGRPVAVMAADVVVDRHAHVVTRERRSSSDDANQVLDRRYRTTLRYRCGSAVADGAADRARAGLGHRHVAVPDGGSRGKRCEFRIVVARIGQAHLARSAILRRAL